MHLMALGAFWQVMADGSLPFEDRLNAPFGARCFLTISVENYEDTIKMLS